MGIETYRITPGLNTALFPELMNPSAVNDGMRTVQSDLRNWYNDPIWIQYGDGDGAYTAAYASAGSFTIADADVTDEYHDGRRVKITGSLTGTVYGVITSSSYSDPNTTVVVTLDSGALESESLTVWLSAISATNSPIPDTIPLLGDANTWSAAQTFSSNVSVGGTLGVTGASTLTGNTTVGGTLGVTGVLTATTGVSVGGDLTVTGTINTFTLTSMSAASFADQSTAEAGSSTTTVMNPARTANAIADDDLLIGNRTSAGTANYTDEVVVKLTGGGLRRLTIDAIDQLTNTPDYDSDELAMNSGPISVEHGLGTKPRRVKWALTCSDAGGDSEAAQGDSIVYTAWKGGSENAGFTVLVNATHIKVYFQDIRIVQSDNTGVNTLDLDKWTIRLWAWIGGAAP